MPLRRILPRLALCALGLAASLPVCASPFFSTSGRMSADNSVVEVTFTSTSSYIYTFSTTSYASGGFNPVLTLFSSTGAPLDNFGSGTSDATLMDALSPGTYFLTLTEFPNVAINTLADGFLFASDPSITGDLCGVPGGKFYDSVSCTQRTGKYSLTSTIAPTPEPSSWMLMASGVAVLAYTSRRRLFV